MSASRTFPLDRPLARVAVGALAIGLLARIEVPFVPVPATLLTLGAMLAGLALPRREALGATLAFLLAGAAGLPAFAGGRAGVATLFGPTGGYLLALPLLAFAYSLAGTRRGASRVGLMALGSVAHLLLGTLWLAAGIGLAKALALGFTPFLLAEGAKMGLALGWVKARGGGE